MFKSRNVTSYRCITLSSMIHNKHIYPLLSTHYVPGSVLRILHVLSRCDKAVIGWSNGDEDREKWADLRCIYEIRR